MPGAAFQRHASKHAKTLENDILKKPYEIAIHNFVSFVNLAFDIAFALH
jgi:hypothetical protein